MLSGWVKKPNMACLSRIVLAPLQHSLLPDRGQDPTCHGVHKRSAVGQSRSEHLFKDTSEAGKAREDLYFYFCLGEKKF